MCTAATYKTNDFYFGRTLDYEFSYGDEITVTPRNYPFKFRNGEELSEHYAFLGMAHVCGDYPLYYEAANEKGLCAAGLNFVNNAKYFPPTDGKTNVAQFEFIPYILGKCQNLSQAKELLANINITNAAFNDKLPCASLHWLIADKTGAITVESVNDGLKIYDNPVGVLTNNPPFETQMFMLNNFMSLSNKDPENTFCGDLRLSRYSRGMGALGLPGDLSSSSRFVRAAFIKLNSLSEGGEKESVGQFFHILGGVEQQRGLCEVSPGKYEITIYTSCINADKGIYYYTTYGNRQISAVNMHNQNLNGASLYRFAPISEEQIFMQN